MNDTIAAISTPFGEGAVAILRMSGPRALAIADNIFRGKIQPSTAPARFQHLGALYHGEAKIDDVLLTVFRAPASYTGEDLIEIGCHGGVLVTRRVLEALLAHGARSAEPGEFTQRAYLHGKMDLTQAEAVMDLITAQTDLALRAATEQLAGSLGERIRGLRETFLALLAHVEAYIDFPDEDIDPDTNDVLLGKLEIAVAELDALLATAARGRLLREGVRTVIFGAPNVGKSSLLNVLLGVERAIVSARPGTTRDVIEEVINVHGLPIRLIDTAGIRDAEDEIERAGIERTRQQVERADLVLRVVDASAPPPHAEEETPSAVQTLLVLNKADLDEHPGWNGVEGIRVSCLRSSGIDALAGAIAARMTAGDSNRRDWSVAINARHAASLQHARAFAVAAQQALRAGISPEFVAEELRSVMSAVGDVVGQADTEEILGRIFSSFCIGK